MAERIDRQRFLLVAGIAGAAIGGMLYSGVVLQIVIALFTLPIVAALASGLTPAVAAPQAVSVDDGEHGR